MPGAGSAGFAIVFALCTLIKPMRMDSGNLTLSQLLTFSGFDDTLTCCCSAPTRTPGDSGMAAAGSCEEAGEEAGGAGLELPWDKPGKLCWKQRMLNKDSYSAV